MDVDASKLLFLKGSTAAQNPKVSVPEPLDPDELDVRKLLSLKGGKEAQSVKVGIVEPRIASDPS